MDSYGGKPSRFVYSDPFSGILHIHVHHARNIHNICIYDNQDVYAKFSLTYNPDDTFSTRIIAGGGKNPDFNDHLLLKINQADAVLKCEIWMMSRAKTYMDDQLLGFALVPISSLSGKGKVTRDYDLSSTDLFHSPAGTIKLSLSLEANTPLSDSYRELAVESNVTSELLVDKSVSEEYSRVEFPDMNVVAEDQQMVSEFFAKNGSLLADGSFLHLGVTVEDNEYEMTGNSSDDGSIQNSGFLSSTMTSLSDDPNSADSIEKKQPELQQENEEAAMQQQIVDMYMRSMQQFTESLAKMKLPMDLDRTEDGRKTEMEDKKDSSRVFYGSRAFF